MRVPKVMNRKEAHAETYAGPAFLPTALVWVKSKGCSVVEWLPFCANLLTKSKSFDWVLTRRVKTQTLSTFVNIRRRFCFFSGAEFQHDQCGRHKVAIHFGPFMFDMSHKEILLTCDPYFSTYYHTFIHSLFKETKRAS